MNGCRCLTAKRVPVAVKEWWLSPSLAALAALRKRSKLLPEWLIYLL
jgi:hypothetical protein